MMGIAIIDITDLYCIQTGIKANLRPKFVCTIVELWEGSASYREQILYKVSP